MVKGAVAHSRDRRLPVTRNSQTTQRVASAAPTVPEPRQDYRLSGLFSFGRPRYDWSHAAIRARQH